MVRKKQFPFPHHIDEDCKTVYVHVVSGYPTVMIVPKKVEEYFPGYKSCLVSEVFLEELKSRNE